MILTKEFLLQFESCKEGYRFGLENDLINKDYDYAIKFCRENGQEQHAIWLEEQKNTEAYIKFNGVKTMVKAYKVFNPLTGLHETFNTEDEAKIALCEVAKQVLNTHLPLVVEELINEQGDSTWIPTELHKDLKVIL